MVLMSSTLTATDRKKKVDHGARCQIVGEKVFFSFSDQNQTVIQQIDQCMTSVFSV